jgi:membrane protein implicated in regulation of membrane protease activity
VGAALWDLVGSRSRLPWWSAAAAASLFAARWLPVTATVTGLVRLAFVVICLTVLVAPRRRTEPRGRRTILRYPEQFAGPLAVADPAGQAGQAGQVGQAGLSVDAPVHLGAAVAR